MRLDFGVVLSDVIRPLILIFLFLSVSLLLFLSFATARCRRPDCADGFRYAGQRRQFPERDLLSRLRRHHRSPGRRDLRNTDYYGQQLRSSRLSLLTTEQVLRDRAIRDDRSQPSCESADRSNQPIKHRADGYAGYKQQCLGHRSGPRLRELPVHWHRIHQRRTSPRTGASTRPWSWPRLTNSLWKLVSRHGLRPRLVILTTTSPIPPVPGSAAFPIRLDGANQTIKNSYISGFCCFQSDTPTVVAQSEGIAIPTGPGPFTITNNFVEAFG